MNSAPSESNQEIDVQIQQAAPAQLPEGPDPAEGTGSRLIKLGQPTNALRVFMSYPCLKQLLAHAQRNLKAEVCGVLLGRIFRSPRGLVTTLTEAVPALYTEASRGHVTFSHDSWQDIYQYLESLGKDTRIVGWYHTHPDFGVFFSTQDDFIQQNFFGSPGQVGAVVDPCGPSMLLYSCENGEVKPLSGMWITADAESYRAARQLVASLQYRSTKSDNRR